MYLISAVIRWKTYICNVCTYSQCTFRRPSVWTLKETEHPVFHIGSLQLSSQEKQRRPASQNSASHCTRSPGEGHSPVSGSKPTWFLASLLRSHRGFCYVLDGAHLSVSQTSPHPGGAGPMPTNPSSEDADLPRLLPALFPLVYQQLGYWKGHVGWMQPRQALGSCVWSGRCERGRLKWEKCFHVRIF